MDSVILGIFQKYPVGPNSMTLVLSRTALVSQVCIRLQCVLARFPGVLTVQSVGVAIQIRSYLAAKMFWK